MDEQTGSGSWRSTTGRSSTFRPKSLDVVVTQAAVDGRTLAELATESFARSVFLRRLARGGTTLAMLPATAVHRGDVLTIVGPSRRLADAVQHIGSADRPTDATDMVLVAFGIVAGALLGIPAIMLGGIEIGLEPERRRPARRPRVRLAAVDVAALLRPDSRSDAVDVRIDRAGGVRGGGRAQRRDPTS